MPSIVGRASIQRASSLVGATNAGLQTTGWAVAAALLGLVSVGTFFAINAASFFVSALLLWRIEARPRATVIHDERRPRLGGGLAGLRRRTGLPVAVAMLGAGMTVMTGVWTVGIAELAHSTLDLGAAGLALLLAATALGTISAAAFLTRRAVRRKVLASCLAWTIALPGYVLLGLAGSLPLVLLGTFFVGAASSAAILLVSTATQESLPDDLLGRGMGVVFLGHVGTKPLGLIAIGPLYAVVDPAVIFVAGGLVVFAAALVSASIVYGATVRANLARATA